MGAHDIAQLAHDFGPIGLMVGYLIWDKTRSEAKWLSHEEQRLRQDVARTEADKAMAVAVNALTIVIEGRR